MKGRKLFRFCNDLEPSGRIETYASQLSINHVAKEGSLEVEFKWAPSAVECCKKISFTRSFPQPDFGLYTWSSSENAYEIEAESVNKSLIFTTRQNRVGVLGVFPENTDEDNVDGWYFGSKLPPTDPLPFGVEYYTNVI